MEKEKKLPVRVSMDFNFDLDNIYTYWIDTFGTGRPNFTKTKSGNLLMGYPSTGRSSQNAVTYLQNLKCTGGLFSNRT
jgi:hypothetical protein